jgi:hypothetical protein
VKVTTIMFFMLTTLLSVSAAFAQQSGSGASTTDTDPYGWKVNWVPFYLWMSGLNGNVGVRGHMAPVDASFSDVFDKLNIGYMTALDVRYDRVGVLTDLVYIDLGADKAFPNINAFTGAHADVKQFFVDPELYARLFANDRGSVDALAGFRYWHLRNKLRLDPGTLPGFSGDGSQNFVDPVLGARFRLNLQKGWFATLKGDVGGFGAGSELSWQIYSGVGKEFKQKYSLLLAYRRLDVDYRNNGFLFDTKMNGVMLGFAIRLK